MMRYIMPEEKMIVIKTPVDKLDDTELERSPMWEEWEEETRFDNRDENDWHWNYCDNDDLLEDDSDDYYYFPGIAGGA
jgi:hypothetical protein